MIMIRGGDRRVRLQTCRQLASAAVGSLGTLGVPLDTNSASMPRFQELSFEIPGDKVCPQSASMPLQWRLARVLDFLGGRISSAAPPKRGGPHCFELIALLCRLSFAL